VSGRQMYLKELHAAARELMSESGQPTPPNFAKMIMRSHSDAWLKKKVEARNFYDKQATARSAHMQAVHDVEVEQVKSDLEIAKKRMVAAASVRPHMVLRDCRWEEADFVNFRGFYEDAANNGARVAERRQALAYAPPVRQLVDGNQPAAPPGRTVEWLSQVCNRRAYFEDTVLMWGNGADRQIAKFIFASRQPMYVGICLMRDITDHAHDDAVCAADGDEQAQALVNWRYVYEVDSLAHHSLADVVPQSMDDVRVQPHVVHLHGAYFGCDAGSVSLKGYVNRFPPETGRQGPAPEKRPRLATTEADALLKAHPWLKETVGTGKKSVASLDVERFSESSSSSEEDAGQDEDGAVVRLFRRLEAVLPEIELAKTMGDGDFHVVVLGGMATLVRDGASYQGTFGSARAGEWCRTRGLRLSASFLMDLYTPAGAATLARAWCHKMQWFFNLTETVGLGDENVFTKEQFDAYSEPTELGALLADPAAPKGVGRRADQVRKLFK
jgi:hypothetical protein